jgi:hypothetical protein
MDSGNGMEAECKLHHIESPPQVDKTRWEGIPVHPGPSGLSEYAKKHGMASTGLRRTLNEKKLVGKVGFCVIRPAQVNRDGFISCFDYHQRWTGYQGSLQNVNAAHGMPFV